MRARSFSHVGITVSDFNKAVRFYWEVFGCPLVGVADTPPDRVRAFFKVQGAQPSCKIGWIRVPGGAVLEIFEFQPQLPPDATPWNKVGLTHISFNVRNLQRWYDYLVSQGVECVSKPERSPRGHSFFFAKDFDGNKPAWQQLFSKIYLKAKDKGVPMYLITNQPAKAQFYFNESNHFNIPVLTCDGTVMKTILRTKTGIVAMNGATVAGKWPEKNMNDIIVFLNHAKN